MAAIYRPSDAISLLRPRLLLPRTRRAALSTTRPTLAGPSTSPPRPPPPPPPPRKSITLTGDTGQVRWSDLSPGEKAVRTAQQSANLVVVVVGVLATVRISLPSRIAARAHHANAGRRRLLPLCRCRVALV